MCKQSKLLLLLHLMFKATKQSVKINTWLYYSTSQCNLSNILYFSATVVKVKRVKRVYTGIFSYAERVTQ